MAGVARVDDAIKSFSTSDGGYCVEEYTYSCNCDEDGCSTCTGYNYDSADVTGKVTGGSSNVFVNGKKLTHRGASTSETANCPSGYDGDSSGSGAITSGSTTVFVNGSHVAMNGSEVNTHTGDDTSINGGSTNVFVGG